MSQLNLRIDERRLRALRWYAARRRTPVTWLVRDYVDYLLSGGQPIVPASASVLSAAELARLAQAGRAFDWLADEPDIYSEADGEPV